MDNQFPSLIWRTISNPGCVSYEARGSSGTFYRVDCYRSIDSLPERAILHINGIWHSVYYHSGHPHHTVYTQAAIDAAQYMEWEMIIDMRTKYDVQSDNDTVTQVP